MYVRGPKPPPPPPPPPPKKKNNNNNNKQAKVCAEGQTLVEGAEGKEGERASAGVSGSPE